MHYDREKCFRFGVDIDEPYVRGTESSVHKAWEHHHGEAVWRILNMRKQLN